MPFDTVDEAVELANDSRYGLSASVFAGTEEEGLKSCPPHARRRNQHKTKHPYPAQSTNSNKTPSNLSGLGRSRMGPAGVETLLPPQTNPHRPIHRTPRHRPIRRTRHQHLTWERGRPALNPGNEGVPPSPGTRASRPQQRQNALAPPTQHHQPNHTPSVIIPPAGSAHWRGMAQAGSASALGAEGQRFKSVYPDQSAESRRAIGAAKTMRL